MNVKLSTKIWHMTFNHSTPRTKRKYSAIHHSSCLQAFIAEMNTLYGLYT